MVDSTVRDVESFDGEFLEIQIDEDNDKVELYFSESTSGSAFLKLSDLTTSPSITMPSGCNGATFQWPDLLTTTNATKTLGLYFFESGIRIHCNDVLIASIFFKELGENCDDTFSSTILSNGSYPILFDTSTTSAGVRTRINSAIVTAETTIVGDTFESRGLYKCYYFSIDQPDFPTALQTLDFVIGKPETLASGVLIQTNT